MILCHSAVNTELIPAPISSSALLPPLLASLCSGAHPELTQPALVEWGQAGAFLLFKVVCSVLIILCLDGCGCQMKYNYKVI